MYLNFVTNFTSAAKKQLKAFLICLAVVVLLVATASFNILKAQYTNVHYIAPSPWNYFSRFNELVITTTSTTPVAVTIAASDGTVYANSLTTVAGAPLRYRFSPVDATANFSNVVLSGQGLKISASVPIGVQVRNIASDNYTVNGQIQGPANNCVQKGNTAFTSLGDQGLGTSFRVGYYANVSGITCYAGETAAPLYTAMAINNNTNIYVNGALLTTLNAGQSYIFQTAIGNIVTSSDYVVMNSGMRADNSSGCGDGVESQIIPIANLGNTYVVIRSNGNTGYERSTIVATKANTTVTVTVPSTNNTTTYTLATAGSSITINNGDGSTAYSSCYIESNNPVAVYTGSADGCEIDMIVQPPLNNCAGSFDVQTNQFLNNSIGGNTIFPYFGYVIIKSDTAIVYFNGVNLESIVGKRTQIGLTGYYLIRYTNMQLGNPANLRFIVNARINVALIESGAGYSMSAFISSISNPMPPPLATSNCLPTTFTAQGGFNSYQWYKDSVAVTGATAQNFVPTSSGKYSVTGTNQNCGTSAISTAIAVNPKPNAGLDQTVCNNSIVALTGTNPTTNTWIAQATNPAGATLSNTSNGIATVNLSSSAVGVYNFIYSAGCADTASILVKATSKSVTTASICNGNIYSFNGRTYTSTKTDTVRLANSVGCDSLAILNLTVKPTSSSSTTASICAGSSYTFNGTSYTTSGTYSKKFTNSVGCDSIAYLVLTVNPTSSSTTNASICAGSSYNFNGTTYTTAGTYTATLTNSKGCDSIATLILSLKATSSSTTTASICAGNTYTFNGVSYSNAGTYTATLINAQGCDSIATLILTVKATSSSTTNASIVSGSSYIFNGTTYSMPGTYTARLTNAQGCDSIATLVLSVTSLSTTNATICSGNSYVFNGVAYATSGTYTAKLKNMYGFDSTATLKLTVKNTSSSTTNASICSGQSYTFNGITYTSAGTYTYTTTNSVGCDSVATLVLTVKSTSNSTTTSSICAGSSYQFNGVSYIAAGTYTAKLTNAVGCDSNATLILTVKPTSSSTTTASICSNSSYIFNGTSYKTSGTYTAKLTNSVGCDSIATLVLTVKPTSSSTTTASICSSSSYLFNGTSYTASGTYTKTLTNSVGCDSVATLVLTVNSNPTISAITGASSTCVGSAITYSSATSGGIWSATNSGTVASINPNTGVINPIGSGVSVITYTVTNGFGCTSQITKSLTVNPIPSVAPITGASSTCVGSSVTLSNASYGGVWSSSNHSVATVAADGTLNGTSAGSVTISYTLSTATCSTTVTKQFNTIASSASTTNISICSSALPFTWNGLTFSAAGTQTAHLTNYLGCDSAATLVLTVKATSSSSTNISICPSTLPYIWNGLTLNAAGTYTKTLTNSIGCDSVATLVLSVKSTSASSTNVSVCASALPYSWNGINRTAAGTYTYTTTSAVGCDSIATLVLSVKSASASTANVSICASALPYSWNGINRTAAGTYTYTTINAVGCDSVATLVLSVKSASASTTNVSVCASALPYSWNGINRTAAGTYTYTTTNSVGCDSIATLILSIKSASTSTTNVSICASALPYNWNGIDRTAAGTYTYSTTNSIGCDSVATLVMSVKSASASSTSVSVCASELPYSWNGINRTAAGTYTYTTTNAAGCDSVATLVLSVKSASASSTNVSVCASELPYSWNGINRTAAGTYSYTTINAVGCDSVATLVLSIKSASASTTNVSICASALPYSWNGINRTAAGTYTYTTTNSEGCDSVATLVLSIKSSSTSTTNVSICADALPYNWNGLDRTAAGTYTYTTTNAVGCDSIATLILEATATAAMPVVTGNTSICAGKSTVLTASSGHVTYQWYFQGVGSNHAFPILSASVQTYTATQVGMYTVYVSDVPTGNCGSLSAGTIVSEVATPVVAPITGIATVCTSGITNLFNANTGGVWSSSNPLVATVNASGLVSGLAVGATNITYSVTNGCGTDSKMLAVSVSDCGVSSGSSGGTESKSLGDVITKLTLTNAKAGRNGWVNYDLLPVVGAAKATKFTTLNVATLATASLNDLMPILPGFEVYNTAPLQLTTFTNAEDVQAFDFTKNKVPKAVVFATKTSGQLYNHTKAICDRLKGGTIISIDTFAINGFNLVRFALLNALGVVEYAASFSIGTSANRNSFSVQSNWLMKDYVGDDVMYNFQLWAVSPKLVSDMAQNIFNKIANIAPAVTVSKSAIPAIYVASGKRVADILTLSVSNTANATSGYFELDVKANESVNGITKKIVPFNLTANGKTVVLIPMSDTYESEVTMVIDGKIVDVLYMSDGAWAVDYDKNTTTVQHFTISNNGARVYKNNEYPVLRNVVLKATTSDYVSIVRLLKGGALTADLSGCKSLKFTASGGYNLRITLVQNSIKDWSKQYSYYLPLANESTDYAISLSQFTSTTGVAINPSEVISIVMSIEVGTGVATQVNTSISNVSFSNDDPAYTAQLASKTIKVYPNPTSGAFKCQFSCEAAKALKLSLVELTTGKTVYSKIVNATEGSNTTAVDVRNIVEKNGMYLVVLGNDGNQYHPKAVVITPIK